MPIGVYTHRRKPIAERFWSKVQKRGNDECWLWTGYTNAKGYGQLGSGGQFGTVLAHRCSYELHVAPIPPGLNVLHKCDRPACVNPAHLFIGTLQDNVTDMIAKGRQGNPPIKYGTDLPWAKLNNDSVFLIKWRLWAGHGRRDIAKDFAVTQKTIGDIARGDTWRHLKIDIREATEADLIECASAGIDIEQANGAP